MPDTAASQAVYPQQSQQEPGIGFQLHASLLSSRSPVGAAVEMTIGSNEIGNRPDRVEPRVKKRRPKPYDAMTKPRSEYKKDYK